MRCLLAALVAMTIVAITASSASAREISGALFGNTLVSSDGSAYSNLLWRRCEYADLLAQLKCEMRSRAERISLPPGCFAGEVEPAPRGPFLRLEETLLVTRAAEGQPFIGADGRRNCRLDNEQTYRGLYSVGFEHSGFYPAAGERWWIDLGNVAIADDAHPPLQIGNLIFLCIEVRGVAMPERQNGYGHMGAYNRLLFVTEVMSVRTPDPSRLSTEPRLSGDENYRVCAQ